MKELRDIEVESTVMPDTCDEALSVLAILRAWRKIPRSRRPKLEDVLITGHSGYDDSDAQLTVHYMEEESEEERMAREERARVESEKLKGTRLKTSWGYTEY